MTKQRYTKTVKPMPNGGFDYTIHDKDGTLLSMGGGCMATEEQAHRAADNAIVRQIDWLLKSKAPVK